MKILVLNCGSSSLKYQLLDMSTERVIAKGNFERIGEKESQKGDNFNFFLSGLHISGSECSKECSHPCPRAAYRPPRPPAALGRENGGSC